VITSDHAMPRFSAPEALKLGKKSRPDLPFIIVSGEIDLNLAVLLMKNGAQSEFEDHCRRRGDPGAIVLPAGTWMRRNPGLLVQPPSTRRRDPGNFAKGYL